MPKISEIRSLACKTRAEVFAVSETWLDDTVTAQEINIPNYTTIRKDRNRKGGGVCIYVRNDIGFTMKDMPNNKSVWIKILLPKTKPIVVGVCYRSPSDNEFLQHFEELTGYLDPKDEHIVLGDFNICEHQKDTACFNRSSEILHPLNVKQLIHDFTRIAKTSSTVIDHILCNVPEKITQSGVLPTGFSDRLVLILLNYER